MIVEVTKPKSSFLDFMLYQEKDDAPRKNMKVINLKVSDKRRQDFTKGAEIEDEEELPEEETTGEETETPTDEPVTDDEDYTDGGEVATGDEPVTDDTDYTGGDEPETETEQPPEETAPEDTTTTDEPATEEPVADTGGGEDAGEAPTEGDTGDGPIIDDEDYTAGGDAEVDAGDEDTGDTAGDTPEENGEEQTDSPVEQLYKYNLYKKFQKVLKSIEEYSIELDNIVSDDFEVNAKYKELTAKLKEIESLMEDYMIMKFSKVSFMQSMLFYQRVVTSVDIILQTLKYVREKDLKSKM